jgi:hypothetical protein
MECAGKQGPSSALGTDRHRNGDYVIERSAEKILSRHAVKRRHFGLPHRALDDDSQNSA